MHKINLKTPEEIEIMAEAGQKLHRVREQVRKAVKAGVSAWDIEALTTKLILEEGAKPSFKMVPGYRWSTCINVNDGVVHGIPKKETVLQDNDIVSVDLGLYFKGFHSDTAFSVYLGDDPKIKNFLLLGQETLKKAIAQTKKGKKIGDISKAIESNLEKAGARPIYSLTGHGIGRELHEYPHIPGFVSGAREEHLEIVPGMVLAVEIMYTNGSGDIKIDKDGWTLRTRDAKIAALFEETVAIGEKGSSVLT